MRAIWIFATLVGLSACKQRQDGSAVKEDGGGLPEGTGSPDDDFLNGPEAICEVGPMRVTLTAAPVGGFMRVRLRDDGPDGQARIDYLTQTDERRIRVRDGRLESGRWELIDVDANLFLSARADFRETPADCILSGYRLTDAQRARLVAGRPTGVCVNYVEGERGGATRSWSIAGYRDGEIREFCRTIQDGLGLVRGPGNNVIWCEGKARAELAASLTHATAFPLPAGCLIP